MSLSVDASLVSEGSFGWLLSSMGIVLRWLIVFSAIFSLVFYFRHKGKPKPSCLPILKPFPFLNLLLHLLVFGVFFTVTLVVFNPQDTINNIFQLVWLVLTLLVLLTWLNLLISLKQISVIYFANKFQLVISGLMAALVILFNFYVRELWQPLSLSTLSGAEWILSLFFNNVYVDVAEKLLGVDTFIVRISPQCSGLEGIIIALTITSIYLFILRQSLRFPLVLVLLPVAALLAIAFNIIRVAMLISIGALFSPEIAVGGFHSVAGWFTAILVSFLIIFVFTSMNIFNKKSSNNPLISASDEKNLNANDDSQLAWAVLIPFILFLVVTLLSNIFFKDFNYLYPLKVIVGLAALIYFWSFYCWQSPQKWLEPVVAGMLVAMLWVLFVPADPEYDFAFLQSIKSIPLWLLLSWCFFRLVGFWLIAPILEELVFRGYLIARLSNQPLSNANKLKFSLFALIISSIIFGFIHNDILVGTLAGIVFAIIRYRHNSLAEPIISHISANIFVALWAAVTGEWVLI